MVYGKRWWFRKQTAYETCDCLKRIEVVNRKVVKWGEGLDFPNIRKLISECPFNETTQHFHKGGRYGRSQGTTNQMCNVNVVSLA